MNQLLPQVKLISYDEGFLSFDAIKNDIQLQDRRLMNVINKLPQADIGAELRINFGSENSESYILKITPLTIEITSPGIKGAFYALQTLKQIFTWDKIPCLKIEDEPDFEYRGLYHDMTRGKIATVGTIKKLIDDMASFKLNSLQLYVEHTYEFDETKELVQKTGCLTAEEIRELAQYCDEQFIDFIPSIATFGHMYEILEQPQYRHLRVLKNYQAAPNFWRNRMLHHTIDPLNQESMKLVKSLIDQYAQNFTSDIFNICGDETFDIKSYGDEADSGELYTNFVSQIIQYLLGSGKKVMMWSDILLAYPEKINDVPQDVYFLNWNYSEEPSEENIMKLSELGRKQIVCPGTSSWSRLCENFKTEESNIVKLIDYGKKHRAIGVLNTNWGDFGNPASLELAMYGIVLGAAKSWRTDITIDSAFYEMVNKYLYQNDRGIEFIQRVSAMHSRLGRNWNAFCSKYFEIRYGDESFDLDVSKDDISFVQEEYQSVKTALENQVWIKDEYRQEILLCAEGVCVMAELIAKIKDISINRLTNTQKWLVAYKQKWLSKNKKSELTKIEEMFMYFEEM